MSHGQGRIKRDSDWMKEKKRYEVVHADLSICMYDRRSDETLSYMQIYQQLVDNPKILVDSR
jgi:hypothetical protein